MILSNVNIGTGPSAGDGDPLRTAFNTINNNFQSIQGNVNSLIGNVTRVAGRTGNVVLTTLDIIGINNYATVSYVNSQLSNAGSYSNVNVTAFLPSYTGNIAAVITANTAMKGYVDASIANLVDSAPGTLDTLNELAAALGDDPNLSVTLTNTINSANTKMKAYVDGQITAANTLAYSNVNTLSYLTTNSYATQNYVNLANTSMKSYVDGQVAAANSQSYSNVNVSTYLPEYTGNLSVNTIIFDDLSQQTTAWTGTQWRSNLSSNVTVKPSWLSYVPGLKTQQGTQYGFDTGGMFFTSNSDNDFAYPIQTNLRFHEQDVLEVTASIYYSATNNDHGLCIFPAGTRPIWRSSIDTSRVAFQFSSGIPVLYGQLSANTAPGSPILSAGNYYTIKFTYDPTNTVTVQTFSGNTATGSALDTRSISEILPPGDYQLGFDADNDAAGVKSYWTNLVVRTLTNTVVNDIEVQGQVTGDLIPSANVTYSLGNITHQWQDLWVSNATIYMGGVPLSVDAGGNLLINGNAVGGISDSIQTGNSNVVVQPNGGITISANNSSWTFGNTGTLTVPGDIVGSRIISTDDISILGGDKTVGSASAEGGDIVINGGTGRIDNGTSTGSGGDVRLLGGDGGDGVLSEAGTGGYAEVTGGNGGFANSTNSIQAGDGGYVLIQGGWAGDNDGDLSLSGIGGNVDIYGGTGSFDTANSRPYGSSGHVNLYGGNWGYNFVPTGNIYLNTYDGTNFKTLSYDYNGTVTVPGAINLSSGQAVTAPSATAIKIRGSSDDSGAVFDSAGESEIYANTNVYIYSDQSGSQKTWNFDNTGNLVFPDNTVQTTAYTGSSYSNVEVATYLPTYTGNIQAGNVLAISALRFSTGNVRVTNDNNRLNLIPDTAADALSGVVIGGNGYILAPNGARNITLNYGGGSGVVGLQANVTIGTAATSTLTVNGNTVTGNLSVPGTSGKIGFSSGGFVQQATSNSTGVTSHTTSGNIQLMNINLGTNSVHTVALTNNKLTTNDIIVVNHILGGTTSVVVDAYVVTDGLALIWLRDITGSGTGNFTPMLKYAIIQAPSS